MKIKYIGVMTDGYVEDRVTETKHPFKRNVPIEVRDEFGAELILQPIWVKSSEQRKKDKGR